MGLCLGQFVSALYWRCRNLAIFTMASVHLLHLEEKMKKPFAGFIVIAVAALLAVGSAAAQCKP